MAWPQLHLELRLKRVGGAEGGRGKRETNSHSDGGTVCYPDSISQKELKKKKNTRKGSGMFHMLGALYVSILFSYIPILSCIHSPSFILFLSDTGLSQLSLFRSLVCA